MSLFNDPNKSADRPPDPNRYASPVFNSDDRLSCGCFSILLLLFFAGMLYMKYSDKSTTNSVDSHTQSRIEAVAISGILKMNPGAHAFNFNPAEQSKERKDYTIGVTFQTSDGPKTVIVLLSQSLQWQGAVPQ